MKRSERKSRTRGPSFFEKSMEGDRSTKNNPHLTDEIDDPERMTRTVRIQTEGSNDYKNSRQGEPSTVNERAVQVTVGTEAEAAPTARPSIDSVLETNTDRQELEETQKNTQIVPEFTPTHVCTAG